MNATHQQRWELFGGEGPAPPYFRAGDQYHVDRVFAEQAGDVEAALHQRLADGWRRMGASAARSRVPMSASWREVQDLLGANPHAVHSSESPAFHQMTWEGAGGTGPAPPIFRFGEDHLRVNVDSLSAGQSSELRSLLH